MQRDAGGEGEGREQELGLDVPSAPRWLCGFD